MLATIQSHKRFWLLRPNFKVPETETYALLHAFDAWGFKGGGTKPVIRDAKVKSVSAIEAEAVYT